MNEKDGLAGEFEGQRSQLRSVAYRMLGSVAEADDAVQEAWLRLNRTDADTIENLTGWLTTVVSRICLDMLRTRRTRGEVALAAHGGGPGPAGAGVRDPEQEAVLTDSVGLALLVVLERLAPAERVAFVLHDLFALPFDEVAAVVGRTPGAARQLASRARRRVRGPMSLPDADRAGQRAVVEAYMAASRRGDFDALLAVLDPDVVVRSDAAAVKVGASAASRGAETVAAEAVARGARFAAAALVDGAVGIVVAPRGRLMLAIGLTVADGRIVAVDVTGDPARLALMELAVLED